MRDKTYQELIDELHLDFAEFFLAVMNALCVPKILDWIIEKVEDINDRT